MGIKLFTHTDLDGIGCAILCQCVYGVSQVDIEFCNYDDINTKINKYLETDRYSHNKILVTDISVDKETAELINSIYKGDDFVLLDHHKTALYLNEYSWGTVKVKDDNGQLTSGTSLLMNYMVNNYNNLAPGEYGNMNLHRFVELVRLYDTWEWKTNDMMGEDAYNLNELFKFLGRDAFIDNMINKLLSDNKIKIITYDELNLLNIIAKNKLDYMKRRLSNMVSIKHDNMSGYITFAENHISELGNYIVTETGCDFAVIINMSSGTVSLRSDRDNVDVSEIAKKFGGGGHAKASGFVIRQDNILEFIKKYFEING